MHVPLLGILYSRKILVTSVLVFIISNETSFNIFMGILVGFHVFLRTAFNKLHLFIDNHYPYIFEDGKYYIASWYAEISAFAKPYAHRVIMWISYYAIGWILQSPRYLCAMNSDMLALAARVLNEMPVEMGEELMEKWAVAEKAVISYCKALEHFA